MITIAFTNQKGGCCKTTSAWHTATGLNNIGNRVLVVDLDPQANLALSADVDLLNMDCTLHDVFSGKAKVKDAVIPVRVGIDILVGGLSLSAADMEFTRQGREFMLVECLEELQSQYDYCVIDTSPSLGVMTMNALTASNMAIIPMQADVYALQGMSQLNGFIGNIQKYSNKNLKVGGLLVTKHNERGALTQALQEQIEDVASKMNSKVFNAKIRNSVKVSQAAAVHSDLYEYAPNEKVTSDYKEFIDELLN